MRTSALLVGCMLGWLALAAPAVAAPDVTPPSVTFTTPTASASVTGVVTISVRATDASGVQNLVLTIDGAPVATSASGSLDYVWDTTQGAEGASHTLAADAYDGAWNHRRTQISVTVPDLRAPTAAILTPANGASVTGTTNVVLSASDAEGIARLVLTIDGQIVADRADVTNFTHAWNTQGLPETSQRTLVVDAYDPSGNRGTQTRVVSIRDASGPVVTWAAPSSAIVITPTVEVDVRASDVSGVRQMVLYVDGAPVAEQSAGDSLTYAWDASQEPSGTRHVIDTDAYDQIGHRSRITREIVITDVEAPQVRLPRPRSTEAVFGLEMIEVAASDNKKVQRLTLRIDGQVVREELDSTGFFYLWETASHGVGAEPRVTATAQDAAGNQSHATTEFAVVAEPVASSGAPLAMAASPPDGDETGVAAFFADARAHGAQVLYWYLNWAEAAENPQGTDALMAQLGEGGRVAVTFDLVHSTVLSTYPAPFQSFTDPGFAEAFSDYAAYFARRYEPEHLFVGNEANLYLESHPGELAAYLQLIRRTREKVAATGAATRVGVTYNYHGTMTDERRQTLRALADEADLIGYTAYGYRAEDGAIVFDDPAGAILMLEELPALYPGKPFAIVETGWNTSARFGSNESLQRDFIRLLRHHAERSPAEFIDLFLLQDGQDCTAAALSFSPPGSNPDPQSPEVQDLAEYLCRFGLRRANGTGKSAWSYLAQTSWPVPEPSTAGSALVAIGCLALLRARTRR
jgi:hypothetical protein